MAAVPGRWCIRKGRTDVATSGSVVNIYLFDVFPPPNIYCPAVVGVHRHEAAIVAPAVPGTLRVRFHGTSLSRVNGRGVRAPVMLEREIVVR